MDAGPGRRTAIPTLLGGYHLEGARPRRHGGGLPGRQLSRNRNVAFKVMKPQWASNATFVARFTREAYAAAQLTHHNIVQIYDFGEDKGTTYFSMEFVEGQTLGGLIREKQRLDVEEAVGLRPPGGARAQVCSRPEHDPPRHQARKPALEPPGGGQGGRPGTGEDTRSSPRPTKPPAAGKARCRERPQP